MGIKLAEIPQLGRRSLRLLRVRPNALQEETIALRSGMTSDRVCKQLHNLIPQYSSNYVVPWFIDLKRGEIKISVLQKQLGQDFVSNIGHNEKLLQVLDDPNDTLCQRKPQEPFLFYWDSAITSKEELLSALQQRGIMLDSLVTNNLVISGWKSSQAHMNILQPRGKAEKTNVLEGLIGRLGKEDYLEDRTETHLILGAYTDILADKVDAYRAFISKHPALAFEFSRLDLGSLSLEMACEILGISELSISTKVSPQHKEYFKQLLLYANQEKENIDYENVNNLTGYDFNARRIKAVRLDKKGIIFTVEGKDYCYGIDRLNDMRHKVLYSYLYHLVGELTEFNQEFLLDYYEELTKEALAMGITSPDNYIERSNSPFQKLMEKLLDKYINSFRNRMNLPDWVRLEFSRDRAIIQLSFSIEGESCIGSGLDLRFVKSLNPASGNFTFASSSLFSQQSISPTNWERLNAIAGKWKEINPNLTFGVH